MLALAAALAWTAVAEASRASDEDIDVQVRKERSAYEVNLEFTVPATIEQTWNVLADYEHMAQILSSMDSSRIVSRDGNRLTVAQTSHGKVGPLHVSVDGSPRDHVDAVQRDPLAPDQGRPEGVGFHDQPPRRGRGDARHRVRQARRRGVGVLDAWRRDHSGAHAAAVSGAARRDPEAQGAVTLDTRFATGSRAPTRRGACW